MKKIVTTIMLVCMISFLGQAQQEEYSSKYTKDVLLKVIQVPCQWEQNKRKHIGTPDLEREEDRSPVEIFLSNNPEYSKDLIYTVPVISVKYGHGCYKAVYLRK